VNGIPNVVPLEHDCGVLGLEYKDLLFAKLLGRFFRIAWPFYGARLHVLVTAKGTVFSDHLGRGLLTHQSRKPPPHPADLPVCLSTQLCFLCLASSSLRPTWHLPTRALVKLDHQIVAGRFHGRFCPIT
jgi:hypothetical protein